VALLLVVPVLLRIRGSPARYAAPKALLLLAYLGNVAMALIGFPESVDLGWDISLVLAAVWGLDLMVLLIRRQ
jgi:hypothetical protein